MGERRRAAAVTGFRDAALAVLGIEQRPVTHTERLVSALGGATAILGVFLVSRAMVGSGGAAVLVASMGASAVLLFAVPHGQLSQPWPVLGGHLVSALVGVTCARLVPGEVSAAALAIGVAIGAMYYLRCLHPPGGATALSAVVGGEAVHGLGYQFVLTPVLINVVLILAVAVAFNALLPWRRYPAALARTRGPGGQAEVPGGPGSISHGDFVYALTQVDSFIDVSEHDLLRIYDLATGRPTAGQLAPGDIGLGRSYSNGAYGDDWAVRTIVDESPSGEPDRDMVIYKVVAGPGRRSSGCVTRRAFAHWARHEVRRDEENWKRVPPEAG